MYSSSKCLVTHCVWPAFTKGMHYKFSFVFTHTHTLSIVPSDIWDSNKELPQLSFLGQRFVGVPAVVWAPHFRLSNASPCIPGPATLSSAFSCPVHCCHTDRFILLSDGITYPPPSHNGAHALLFAQCKRSSLLEMVSLQTLGQEGRQISQITFCRSPALWPLQKDRQNTALVCLKFGVCSILWRPPHIVERILNLFLALFSLFRISMPAPPSCISYIAIQPVLELFCLTEIFFIYLDCWRVRDFRVLEGL